METDSGKRGESEVLLGVEVTSTGIDFRVASGGCTKKEHFDVSVLGTGFGAQVTLYRTVPDYCEALISDGVVISFTKAELGLGELFQVSVLNRIGNTSQHTVGTN